MINFRYHLISLTAVFLALGIGIAMGSTVVSEATVNGLRSNLRTVEHNSDTTRAQNKDLRDQLDQQQKQDAELTSVALGPAVADRLEGVPVVVIASKGIDGSSLSAAQTAVTAAGARYEGTLLVDSRLALKGANRARLAELLGVEANDQLPEVLVKRLAAVLRAAAATPSQVARVSGPAAQSPSVTTAPGSTTTVAPSQTGTSPEPSLVTELRKDGFFDFKAPDGGSSADPVLAAPLGGYRYLVVSGPSPEVPNDAFLIPLLRALTAQGPAPVVAASAAQGSDAEAHRVDFLTSLRGDATLDGRLSTVDDLEQYPGLLAVVYALADSGPLGQGRHGHYGVGKGATALLPSVSP